MRRKGDWINTYTGRKMWPLDPLPEDLDIRDIAHALALQCRFTGHVRQFYSVAQHCVEVANRVPEEHKLWALLHDASEAYLTDLARPVKHQAEMQPYRDAEKKLMEAVCLRFELPLKQPECVTAADHVMLITEAKSLLKMHPDWLVDWKHLGDASLIPIDPWNPYRSEYEFLWHFERLTNGRFNDTRQSAA
jgi:hypothetical protein